MHNMHNRMLVIVEPGDYTRWLTVADEALPPIDLLRPYDPDAMKAWKVGSGVGNAEITIRRYVGRYCSCVVGNSAG